MSVLMASSACAFLKSWDWLTSTRQNWSWACSPRINSKSGDVSIEEIDTPFLTRSTALWYRTNVFCGSGVTKRTISLRYASKFLKPLLLKHALERRSNSLTLLPEPISRMLASNNCDNKNQAAVGNSSFNGANVSAFLNPSPRRSEKVPLRPSISSA